MKKVLFLIMCLCVVQVQAATQVNSVNENHCIGKRAEVIQEIERDFDNCNKIRRLDIAKSNAEMDNIYYDATECLQAVAHKIFERYYTKTEEESKENFDDLVKSIYKYNHNLFQKSDIGLEFYRAAIYNTQAISGAYVMVKEIVKEYITEIKQECEEFSEEDIEEMKNL